MKNRSLENNIAQTDSLQEDLKEIKEDIEGMNIDTIEMKRRQMKKEMKRIRRNKIL